MTTDFPRPAIREAEHKPAGHWWRRVVEAFRLAAENRRLRRTEKSGDDLWVEDDLEAKTDNRKGDR